ncbi:MAG: DegT/DnrJ/EryC1/StrS family aminotransferase [Paludibacteraceae bacterium]|nr:DegT/DnrJ/EryC1/StrS family aminotransferase [Paludibacteraceae bacterium]
MNNQITVTSPLLPDLNEYNQLLQDIWSRKWITNNGHYHQELEKQLSEYLGVPYLSLFTNGTLPLITALQALGIHEGEVITTPYSFVATTHSIWWNKLRPVFVDVDPNTGNIDPNKIEAAITDKTIAIMPVHVYGCPCDVERIDAIAKKHNLKVIYDAAHAFGVTYKGKSVLEWGDLSTLSFHATKVYNTIEGGAMVMHSAEMKYDVDNLKNFGFRGETNVVAPGINSKMDEMRAAYGLLNLKQVDWAIEQRKRVAKRYVEALDGVKGIRIFPYIKQSIISSFSEAVQSLIPFKWNFAYFPILITEDFGMSRDELYEKMKGQGVMGRRYFYPLITGFEPYNHYDSATAENLPIAKMLAEQVICLPMHPYLTEEDVERVIKSIVL